MLLACGGGQPHGASAGEAFVGPNELNFLVTAPIRRQMPPERHRGTASVVSEQETTLTIHLRMVAGGDVCEIVATRAGAGPMPVAPTDCSSQFVYEDNPTAATVHVQTGTVTLDGGQLRIDLSGQFVAAIASGDGTSEVSGVARWTFEGRQ